MQRRFDFDDSEPRAGDIAPLPRKELHHEVVRERKLHF